MNPELPRPPGPTGRRWVGNLQDYEEDRLGFLMRTGDTFGPIATFDATTTIVSSPALAREVLSGMDGAVVVRNNVLQEPIPASELAQWPIARRLLNPVLRSSAVAAHHHRIASLVHDELTARSGGVDDAVTFWEPIMSAVAVDYFFGSDGAGLPSLTRDMLKSLSAVVGNMFALPAAIPTPGRLRIRSRFRALKAEVQPLLELRQRAPERYEDGASALMSLWGRTDPKPPLERVCNLVVGNLLASHTVPAAAICWTAYLLRRHPEWLDALSVEAGDILCPSEGDPNRLTGSATLAVLAEANRLYPPTWLLSRKTLRPVELGGYTLPSNHTLLMSPYVLHRREDAFPDPGRFRPERWLNGEVSRRDVFSFGHGPRNCPGRDLAQTTAAVTLALLVSRFDFRVEGDPVPDPRFTLTPRGLSFGVSIV